MGPYNSFRVTTLIFTSNNETILLKLLVNPLYRLGSNNIIYWLDRTINIGTLLSYYIIYPNNMKITARVLNCTGNLNIYTLLIKDVYVEPREGS
jgi:hypothetical protein